MSILDSLLPRAQLIAKRGPRAALSRFRSIVQRPRKDKHILIMHNGRSGSTLLGDMMDQHPDIFWDGETFEKLIHRTAEAENIGVDTLYGRYSLEDGIEEIRSRMKTRAGNRIFGTEIQDYHLEMMGTDLGAFLDKIRPLGFDTFIYLNRNYIRKIVSGLVAVKRNSFHVGAATSTKKPKLHIDPNRSYIGHRFTSIMDALNLYKKFHTDMERALQGEEILNLTYEEDIQNNPLVAAQKICDFANLPRHTPKIKFGKTTNFPLSDIIENYDEIRNLVSNSPFAAHMSADL